MGRHVIILQVKNNTLNLILSAFLVVVVYVVLIPYLIFSISAYKQAEQNKIYYQKFLAQEQAIQQAKADAAEKIYLTGKFDESVDPRFAVVPAQYDIGGYTMYLRKETLAAFEAMAAAAEKDGVEITIASATRNFEYQKNLWNNKWTGASLENGVNLAKTIPDGLERFKEILEYSAVPTTSRHHWGTEIDINDANIEYFNTPVGEKVYEWMEDNAMNFGFCQTYTPKGPDRPTGYNEEKWHWSYLPLSRQFTKDYARLITPADISGFDGDQYVPQMNLIQDYVLDINPACR